MENPWFLDLDGAKSGPYQTQEVLSLVAEGEILPHHLISPHLKDGPWISILEWRLTQAKLIPDSTLEPASVAPPTASAPKPAAPPTEVKINKPLPTANVESPSLTSQPNYTPSSTAPIHSPKNAPAPYTPPENIVEAPRKDPTAEMFDVLQRTKQKREEKLIEKQTQTEKTQTHSPSYSETHKSSSTYPSPHNGNGTLFKTLGTGLLISIFGFWLGQWFQQKSAQPQTPSVAIAPTATPTSEPIAAATPAPAQVMEDRSTDKMIIRGRVAPKAATPPAAATNQAAQALTPSESPNDIKELQDLKKELEELKNLKKELQNSIHDDGFDHDLEQPENATGEPGVTGNGVD